MMRQQSKPENPPFFSIVIPTLNEEFNLSILLKAIAQQTFTDYELVVVDSKSKDGTKKVALLYGADLQNFRFISMSSNFVSENRNYGAKQTSGEWIIFFDADVEPASDFLECIHRRILAGKADIISVWNRSKRRSLNGIVLFGILNLGMSLFQKIWPIVNGPCIIIRRSLFNRLKGFDEDIVYGEDFDIVRRAVKSGAGVGIYRKPVLYVSTRRPDKEGFLPILIKSFITLVYQIVRGPIKKPLFKYEMGGQYYKISK